MLEILKCFNELGTHQVATLLYNIKCSKYEAIFVQYFVFAIFVVIKYNLLFSKVTFLRIKEKYFRKNTLGMKIVKPF